MGIPRITFLSTQRVSLMTSLRNGLMALLVVIPACDAQPTTRTSAKSFVNLDAADSVAAAALERRQTPGLALVVLQEDDTVLARGYGLAELGRTETITESTVFQLGSMGKQFLAALVLVLAEDGLLAVDSPVVRYLPDYRKLPPGVRIRHLLNHTSGLREPGLLPEYQAGADDTTRARHELEAIVRRAPVDFPPGAKWSYSNGGYMVLAFLVERLTGKPYDQLLAERFFRPLGLTSLRQCTPLPKGPGEARGHVLRDGAITTAAPENMNWAWGDGGLCGNALDVARWWRLLATGRVVSPRSYEQMIAPAQVAGGREVDYGFAISRVGHDGLRRVGHGGSMAGFNSIAAYYPDAALTVVVLVNRRHGNSESIERQVARRLLGLSDPVLHEQTVSAEERRRFAGTYDIGAFDVNVVDRDGRLWFEAPCCFPNTALLYLGAGEFASEVEADVLRFTFIGGGTHADELRVEFGQLPFYGTRRQ
jgi:CubicO group peptidase (beta-lactamase class C family)